MGEAIGQISHFADIPVRLARAMANGLSLEGAGMEVYEEAIELLHV